MDLVDTAIVGRLGATEIAGASIGSALFFLVTILGVGILMGLDPLISHAVGASKTEKVRHYLGSGLRLSWLLFIPTACVLFLIWFAILGPIGIQLPVRTSTLHYLLGRIPSILFYYIFITTRCYLQSHQITRPILVTTVLANITNVPVSIALALGDTGLQQMGIPTIGFAGWGIFGAALGTSIITGLQMFVLWYATRKHMRIHPSASTSSPHEEVGSPTREIISIGTPIGLQFLAEGGLFVAVTLLIGRFGETQLGGHQVALQIATFSFTICLGLSSATSVRVGQAFGRGDVAGVQRAGWIGIACAALFMSLSGLVMHLGAPWLAPLFAKPLDVIQAAVGFLGIAAVFQLFDGIQIVVSGALRGAGRTRQSFILNTISHWVFGMPTALLIGFYFGWGPKGLWWGLTTGLCLGSITLTWAFIRLQKDLKLHPNMQANSEHL